VALAQQNAQSAPDRQPKDSPEHAQAMYDEAIARERKVAELAVTGVAALQELEQAQIAVRTAADDLASARRGTRAAATMASARALQAKTQADLALADQQRQRQERLAQLAGARLKQNEAENAIGKAIAEFGDLTLRAPTQGLVTELTVKPGDHTTAGTSLVKLATVDPMFVDIDVPPTMASMLRRGEPVVVHLVDSGHEYLAHIWTVAPLPGKAGTHVVEVAFENPTEELIAGRTAVVRLR
jgi:Cu(I)/Ag(I) efflux system membrane fusion protein